MKSLLLIELLESFSEKEIEKLVSFVSCSCFNKDKYAIKLLEILIKKVLGKKYFGEEMQTLIYQQVFPDSLVSGNKLGKKQQTIFRVKISILMQLAQRFLIIEKLETNHACKNELLYDTLLEKKQFRLMSRRVNEFRKEPDQQVKDIPYYHYQYKTENGLLSYLYHSAQWVKEDNLPVLNQSLDIYYLLNKLKLQVTAFSFMRASSQKQYDFSDMEALKSLLALPQYAEIPLIRIYKVIIALKHDESHHIYLQLLELLDQQEKFISADDLNDFYIVATNFCVRQVILGKLEYYHHLFNLYLIMDDKNLLLEGNLIPIEKLKNIVSTCCRVKDYEQAVYMVEKYYPFVRKEIRNSVRDFNLGLIASHQKDHQKAIDYLYRIDNINLVYDLGRRIMMAKSYYEIETEYKETTAQVFRSTEKYIKENKLLAPKNRAAYKNFIRIVINLYRIRHRVTKMSLESIKEKLERQQRNSDKKWLLDKIKELEK